MAQDRCRWLVIVYVPLALGLALGRSAYVPLLIVAYGMVWIGFGYKWRERDAAQALHRGGCDEYTKLEDCPNDACKARVAALAESSPTEQPLAKEQEFDARAAFDKWYEEYPDTTPYEEGMFDSFKTGYAAGKRAGFTEGANRRSARIAEQEGYAAGRSVGGAQRGFDILHQCEHGAIVKLFDLVQETREKLEPYLIKETFKTGTIPAVHLSVDIILQAAFERATLAPSKAGKGGEEGR